MMLRKLSKCIRIYEISRPRGGCFLKAVNFPFSVIIDTSEFAKLYIQIFLASLFRRERDLEKKLKKILEALSSEYIPTRGV